MISEFVCVLVGNVFIFLVNLVVNGVIIVFDKRNSGNSNVLKVIIWIKWLCVIISKVGVMFIVIILVSGRILLLILESKIVFISIIGVRMLVYV